MQLEETIAIRVGESFDLPAIEHYLREHIEGLGEGTLQVRQFPSGASNLTYLLQVGTWEGVLRRPPFRTCATEGTRYGARVGSTCESASCLLAGTQTVCLL